MRSDVGFVLLAIIVIAIATAVFLTIRYQRYQRRMRHGSPKAKPVWKPFWMN
jgi:uncharacterized membrane protein YidH (DUF202 family)